MEYTSADLGKLSIPDELNLYFNELSASEIDSFLLSWERVTKSDNFYVDFAQAMESTFRVSTKGSEILSFILAKLYFIQGKYSMLEKLTQEFTDNRNFKIYYYMSLIYKAQYDAVKEDLNEELDSLTENISFGLTFIETLQYLQIIYALGLNSIYSRNMDLADQFIRKYELFTDSRQFKKVIPKNQLSNFVLPGYILLIIKSLYSGDIEKFNETIQFLNSWIDSVSDPYYYGQYLNLKGIQFMMKNEASLGFKVWNESIDQFALIQARREFGAVGANLAVGQIVQGRREEGRELLEQVIVTLNEMSTYNMSLVYSLLVSKLYLESNNTKLAKTFLEKAEHLFTLTDDKEPATFAYFANLYSKLNSFPEAEIFIGRLAETTFDNFSSLDKLVLALKNVNQINIVDRYAFGWFINASSVFFMKKGNLRDAKLIVEKGIEVAEKENQFSQILELNIIYLEVLFRLFINDGTQEDIKLILEILSDLRPIILKLENPYYNMIFFIVEAYANLCINRERGANQIILEVTETLVTEETTEEQKKELQLINKRLQSVSVSLEMEFNSEAEGIIDGFRSWFESNNLAKLSAFEGIRLLNLLQLQQATSSDEPREQDEVPALILITKSSGLTAFTRKLNSQIKIDEYLVSALLGAITTFSREVLGSGSLNKIEQEGYVLLLNPIGNDYTCVIVTASDTYTTRRRFKDFTNKLKILKVLDYFNETEVITSGSPVFDIINDLINDVFLQAKSE